MGDLTMNLVNMMACTEEQEEFHKSDTELTDTEDTDANAHTRSLVPSPNLSFTLRPMEQDPTKQYPPFVRMLMRKRPEMRDLVNHLKRRTTAYDLWEVGASYFNVPRVFEITQLVTNASCSRLPNK